MTSLRALRLCERNIKCIIFPDSIVIHAKNFFISGTETRYTLQSNHEL